MQLPPSSTVKERQESIASRGLQVAAIVRVASAALLQTLTGPILHHAGQGLIVAYQPANLRVSECIDNLARQTYSMSVLITAC